MTKVEGQDEDIYVELMDFGRDVTSSEAVTLNPDGTYTIFVNSRMASNRQQEAVTHALGHICRNDFQKENVQQIELEAHGLPVKIQKTEDEIREEKRKARYEAMRKRSQRKRKKIQKELSERSAFVNYLMEHNEKYDKEHTIF